MDLSTQEYGLNTGHRPPNPPNHSLIISPPQPTPASLPGLILNRFCAVHVRLSRIRREVLPFDAMKAHILLTKVDLSNNFISRLPVTSR